MFSRKWHVLLPEDKVKLGIRAALVGSEHDGIGGLVVEVSQVHVGLVAQQFDVAASTILTLL
jgi:hypothetical protein